MAERWETTIRITYTALMVPIGNLNIHLRLDKIWPTFKSTVKCAGFAQIVRLITWSMAAILYPNNNQTVLRMHDAVGLSIQLVESEVWTQTVSGAFTYTCAGSAWTCSHYNRAACYLASLSWVMVKRVAENNLPACSNIDEQWLTKHC